MKTRTMDNIGEREIRVLTVKFLTAVSHGELDAVRRLVREHGIDPNSERDRAGGTALHISVDGDNLEMAMLLRELGIDPKLKDNRGRTAIQYAFGPLTSPELHRFLSDWMFPELTVKSDNLPSSCKVVPFKPREP